MTLTLNTVTGKIFIPAGYAQPGATVHFTLSHVDFEFDTIVPYTVTATIATDGSFSAAMWSNIAGSKGSWYDVYYQYLVPVSGLLVRKALGRIQVPATGIADLDTLLQMPINDPAYQYAYFSQAEWDALVDQVARSIRFPAPYPGVPEVTGANRLIGTDNSGMLTEYAVTDIAGIPVVQPTPYETRAEFMAALLPAVPPLMIDIAGRKYRQDPIGTAYQHPSGVKYSPAGIDIMPEDWAENTTPFATDMSAACLAMGRWLAATNGPHRRVYWGNIGISSPIKLGIGDGTAAWSGYISNITFTGGQIRSIGSTRWAGVASSGILVYPASLIIMAGDTTYSSENIKFERTKFDPRYLCGSIYLENTNYVTIADNYFVGLGCDKAHIQTSIVKAAANVDGKNAKNTELHIDRNKFHGADSSASNMVGRSIDGICAPQAASAGVALTLNGGNISGGEWVTPDGYPSRIGFRVVSTTPQGQAGKRITVNGFADVARTIPLSEVVTYFEWSTEWQHSLTSAFYAVVTSIVPVDTFGINVAVLAERNTTGIWMESADFWLDSNSYKGMTRSNFYDHFANGNVTNDHPYTRSFEVGSDCEGINFSGLYMDFHDGIFYSHGHMFHDSFFLAGNPAIHLISGVGNTSGDGFSFQGNSVMPNRSYSAKGQIFKRHTGDTPWDAVLNIQKVGNAHAVSLGETDDMIRLGRTRNFAIVADALTVPTEYSITLESSTALRFNTNSNSGTSSDIHNFHFGFDGTYLTEFTYDGHYFFGKGLGSAGIGALAIDAGSAYPVIFANGHYAEGIQWSEVLLTWVINAPKLINVPNSSAGLLSGQIWRDAAAGNVLKIIP